MVKVAQMGLALGLLGLVVTLMGLFPGMTGLPPTPGIGVVQILITITGMTLLILGALIYVKFAFYAYKELTLAQQIGIRLSLTGLTFAALTSMADILGFGSNLRIDSGEIVFGPIQMFGLLGSFAIAAIGVLVFAVAGDPEIIED